MKIISDRPKLCYEYHSKQCSFIQMDCPQTHRIPHTLRCAGIFFNYLRTFNQLINSWSSPAVFFVLNRREVPLKKILKSPILFFMHWCVSLWSRHPGNMLAVNTGCCFLTVLLSSTFSTLFLTPPPLRALRRCEEMIQRYSREVNSDGAVVGKAVENCMRAIIGVLLNLTHDNG